MGPTSDDNVLSKKLINTIVKHEDTNLWYHWVVVVVVVVVAAALWMSGYALSLGSC